MRVDCFQDNYGFWRARRGEQEIGPQRRTREEAVGDMDRLSQPGDFIVAEGETSGAGSPSVLPAPTEAILAAERGPGAGFGEHAGAGIGPESIVGAEAQLPGHFEEVA